MKTLPKTSWQKWLKIFYYFLIPLICFYGLEYYTHDPWTMAFLPQLINYLLFLAAGLFLYELTGRSWCGIVFPGLYSLIVGIVNYFVVSFRNNPILPWDLKSIDTALSISDNYTYEIDHRFIISTIVLILAIFSGFLIRHRNKQPLLSRRRLGTCLGAAATLLLIAFGMMETSITSWVLTPTNLFTQ